MFGLIYSFSIFQDFVRSRRFLVDTMESIRHSLKFKIFVNSTEEKTVGNVGNNGRVIAIIEHNLQYTRISFKIFL
jgi:hypothetical protein